MNTSEIREVGIAFQNWKQTSDRLIRIDPIDGNAWRWISGKRTRNGSRVNTIQKVSGNAVTNSCSMEQFSNESLICEIAKRTNSSVSAIIDAIAKSTKN